MEQIATIEQLAAKLAITDVIYRYARGIDRIDMALVRSCYHPDAIDHRPPLYAGPAEGFLAWVEPTLRSMVFATHAISNVLIELRGDEAGVESYWMATLRFARDGALVDLVRAGRYLDRFSRIGGVWAITERCGLNDWSRVHPVDQALLAETLPNLTARSAHTVAAPMPRRDRDDPSYRFLGA